MDMRRWMGLGLGCAVAVWTANLRAQDAGEPPPTEPETASSPGVPGPGPTTAPAPQTPEAAAPKPDADAAAQPSPSPTQEDATPEVPREPVPPAATPPATTATGGAIDASPAGARPPPQQGTVAAAQTDIEPEPEASPATSDATPAPVLTGSHLPRPRLILDGALIIDSPLPTGVQDGRAYLQLRRQLGGAAPPDTTAALGLGAAGTSPSYSPSLAQLRMQPTLVLLNGRRLVAAPFAGPHGRDFVDLNQLPITLIDRVETSSGPAAGLYGDGAVGGVVNFITRRDYDGIEVDVGTQFTDDLDQHEEDVTLTVGVGSERTGANLMVSYFTRQPLAARDRGWIADREERTESLVSSPGSYQPLVALVEYPYPDAFCDIATDAGHASGLELRVPLFGEPVTRDGRDVLGDPDLLPTSPVDYRRRYAANDATRGDGDGLLEAYETSTYCAGNFTSVQDLSLEDERLQIYTTAWHAVSDHTEGFGELGYYRSDNRNRTAPSFPVTRISPDPAIEDRILVPTEHADQPVQYPGFSANPGDEAVARAPNTEFLVGRVVGLHAGGNVNTRSVDVLRGVLGLRGDLEAAAAGSVLETWDWEVAGTYSASRAQTRVPDILLDKLATALASCPATTLDEDVGSATYGMQIPSTIKQRQEAGCYNPFYNSVTNNAAIDPLGLARSNPDNDRGFITTDSETRSDMHGFGLQDGGYICDPNDPDAPDCPDELDPDGDGIYELAGTPNTQQVIDGMTGEHTTDERRTLGALDAVVRGDLARFARGALSFGLGGQYRRETLRIEYDAAFNRRLYAFVFGAPDVPAVSRDVAAGFGELRLRTANGLVDAQLAGRLEHFDDVGLGPSGLAGVAVRPFAAMDSPPRAAEGLLGRLNVGHGHVAPSLLQLHGSYTEFHSVEFADRLHFIPHQVTGNPQLDFETYTTGSAGAQWDYAGIHVDADVWVSWIDDVIGSDNLQTLLRDCEAQYAEMSEDCPEVVLLTGGRTINHVQGTFANLAKVTTHGIDGGVSYTLDSKRRDLGDFGTFVVAVRGSFLNQYLIESPRALREFYRADGGTPELRDGARDYSELRAEYDAAGFRNLENFAPPLPKLRFAVPVSWSYAGHTVGATVRYVGEYNDDSEHTIEKYGLAPPGTSLDELSTLTGERIPPWVVLDAGYGLGFGDAGWQASLRIGVINLLDEPPPAAEGPLGYDVGVHDPRGRLVYVRATGKF